MAGGVIVGAVVGAAVGAYSGYVQKQQARDQQDFLDKTAKVELRNAYARARAVRRRGKLAVQRQRLEVAAAGLDTLGSPLEQLANNTFEVELEASNEEATGVIRARQLRAQGRAIRREANRNFYLSIVSGAISGAASGYKPTGSQLNTQSPTTASGLLAPNNSAVNYQPRAYPLA